MAGIDTDERAREGINKAEVGRTADSSESDWLFITKSFKDKLMESQLRVLCADDDETCELVTTMLGISNIEVKSASTVADAWRLAQTERFDLYLLETGFPDGSGFDLCRRLRKFAPRAPIVFYSCAAYPIDRQKGLAAGANEYLTKPYLADLTAAIRQNIEQTRKSARRTAAANA